MGGPPIVRLLEARSEGAADYGRWGIRLPGSLGHTCPMTDPVLDSPPMRAPILPRTGIGTDVHAFTDPDSTEPTSAPARVTPSAVPPPLPMLTPR